jgi:hypothetical protein
VIEKDGKFIGVACLVAKEVVEKESFVRRFGVSFEKDVQWHAVSSLLDYPARNPMFKAIPVTTSKIPFRARDSRRARRKNKLDQAQLRIPQKPSGHAR